LRHALALSIAGLTACIQREPFVCEGRGGNACSDDVHGVGTCEPTGYCSFADSECEFSHRRYAASAGELAGECVPSVNLVGNAGCELNTNGWNGFQSVIDRSTTARTGIHSCLVCFAPGGTGFYNFYDSPGWLPSPVQGQMVYASAYVSAAPGAGIPDEVRAVLRDEPETTEEQQAQAVPGTVGDWRFIEVMHPVSFAGIGRVYFGLFSTNGVAGDCFLVDDLTMYVFSP
jgi:hypothetical protein